MVMFEDKFIISRIKGGIISQMCDADLSGVWRRVLIVQYVYL